MKSNMVQRVLSLVGWFGTALVFAAVAIRYFKPEWYQYAIYGAYGGMVCVLLYVFGGAFLSDKRSMRYGAMASVSVLVVLGILIAVNYLAARQNKRWDLTSNQQFSLSDQTVQLLKKLDAPVEFRVFERDTNFDRFRARLNEYEYQSKNARVRYIDPDKNPPAAKADEVQAYGTVVIEYKGRKERVTSDSEQDLTNGLIKVVTGEQKKVYFVQGHGEKSTSSSERDGYSTIAAALGRDNYGVDSLVLAQQKDVPTDASVVILAGPKNDLLPGEGDMLRRYLARGGHLFVLLDPPDTDGSDKAVIDGLLKEWAIEPGRNIVVDVSGMGQLLGTDASVPVAASYPTHPITERFNMLTAYPLARSMSPATSAPNGRSAQPLIETSPRSWAETNLKSLSSGGGEVEMNADQGDKPGPVSIGAASAAPATDVPAPANDATKAGGAEPPKPESRVVAIGDSDFVANYAIGIQGNRDLFMNSVSWLAQQENLIAIRPKEADDRRVTLTAQQQTMIFWLSIIGIPAIVLGAGVWTWSRRRQ
jgi:ABC-type uncharacterized transport system involved in gliding motility auxiliary subunit